MNVPRSFAGVELTRDPKASVRHGSAPLDRRLSVSEASLSHEPRGPAMPCEFVMNYIHRWGLSAGPTLSDKVLTRGAVSRHMRSAVTEQC